jgi:Cys-tRNA synthase (O-phospho-L-seryl-tRNA:Cys-tRNA synthase)
MKYVYRNLKKHCTICGIPPGETKEFDHELFGGAIELVEKKTVEKKKDNKKTMEGELI